MAALQNPFWQQTMLRVRNWKESVAFYERHFGCVLVDKFDFPSMSFSLYFMATLPAEERAALPEPGTEAAHQYLWNMKYATIELTYNYGQEDTFVANNGNEEPHRGFGHIAFNCTNVVTASEELEAEGVRFRKRPHEGRMRNIAFCLDPDGYWIELVERHPETTFSLKYNLSQTMLRVKDAAKSLAFYRDIFGMKLVCEKHFPDNKFSLYFLSSDDAHVDDASSPEAMVRVKQLFNPVLELTENHGTADDDTFSYHNGNTDPKGFGHIGFLVDDVYKACESYEKAGIKILKKPDGGKIKGIAFVQDPDGYWVEVIQRGVKIEMNPSSL
mmetsp:Transcript_4745/g.13301  ORF Transcript_4745/g.13301 Transcript_4745/m.13301 type:complete len:328 (-) Transcript_4745:7-990(-)